MTARVRTARSLTGVLAVCGGAASLVLTPPSHADPDFCYPYVFREAVFVISQSDGWHVKVPANGNQISGRAEGWPPGPGAPMYGNAVGHTSGTAVDITVNWDNGHRSRYTGSVLADGDVAGERDDIRANAGPDDTTWSAPGAMKCDPNQLD